jgi:hypothetical protein
MVVIYSYHWFNKYLWSTYVLDIVLYSGNCFCWWVLYIKRQQRMRIHEFSKGGHRSFIKKKMWKVRLFILIPEKECSRQKIDHLTTWENGLHIAQTATGMIAEAEVTVVSDGELDQRQILGYHGMCWFSL